MKFILKLFPEITIKSKPVRQRLVKQLRQNVQVVLRRDFDDAKVQGFWDKIEVRIPDEHGEQVAKRLQDIPGIANILQVKAYTVEDVNNNFDEVVRLTVDTYADILRDKSFVVRVKRVGEHNFKSSDMERYVGGALLKHTEARTVDLKNPDITVSLEIRDADLYVVERRYQGLGGYPIGTQEPVLSLISGGFDSTVSSYMTMKRGLKTHFCFFNLGGSAHEIGVKQVSQYLWERYGVSHRVKFVTVPFEEVVAEILKTVHHSHMGVILKRMMMRAATRVAEEMGVNALVTGESVAQVSSQTLTNLSVIDRVTDMLVLRPLVTMDKLDIIHCAARIGTEDYAKTMPEYCGVISDRPTTLAKMDRVLREEENFDLKVLDAAIGQSKTVKIDEVLRSKKTAADVEVVSVPGVQDVIIDIRHPDEAEKTPLHLTNNAIINIPFYELMSRQEELESQRRYLLYCARGSMSQLHASHLKEQGVNNILVYSP